MPALPITMLLGLAISTSLPSPPTGVCDSTEPSIVMLCVAAITNCPASTGSRGVATLFATALDAKNVLPEAPSYSAREFTTACDATSNDPSNGVAVCAASNPLYV